MKFRQTIHHLCNEEKNRAGAFTFIELLVVIATLAILTVVLFPAFAASKTDSRLIQCLSGKRQLTIAWQMYASDNSDQLVSCTSWIPFVSTMDWSASPANTNTAYLVNPTNALIASYNSNVSAFKCPADVYKGPLNPGPRVRSVSLSIGLAGNSIYLNQVSGRIYISARKMSDLGTPGPAMVFAFLDEQADSIDDGIFALNEGYGPTGEHWRGLPAGYHNGAAGISFADGHVEAHRWQVWSGPFATVYPVHFLNYAINPPWQTATLIKNADYEWMDNRLPYRVP